MTLTAGLSSRIIMSGGYFRQESQIWFVDTSCGCIVKIVFLLANSVDPDEMPYYANMFLMEGKWLPLTFNCLKSNSI